MQTNLAFDTINEDNIAHSDAYEANSSGFSAGAKVIGGTEYHLFPNFHQWTKDRFEERFRYLDLLKSCRGGSLIDSGALVEKGYEVVDALSPEIAGKWLNIVEQDFSSRDPKDAFKADSFFIQDSDDLFTDFVCDLMTEDLVSRIGGYFGSHFAVYYLHINRTSPIEEPDAIGDYSFKWHIDGSVPEPYLKLLFFFNGFEEHGGGTSFLDAETTRRLDEIGYTQCPVPYRLADIGSLCDEYDLPYAPDFVKPGAGQGVLFRPVNVLHKGMAPTKGPRYAAQVGFIPHRNPWQQTFEENIWLVRQIKSAIFPRFTGGG